MPKMKKLSLVSGDRSVKIHMRNVLLIFCANNGNGLAHLELKEGNDIKNLCGY